MSFIVELLEIEDNLSFMIFTACLSNLVIHIRDYYWGCNILFIEQ